MNGGSIVRSLVRLRSATVRETDFYSLSLVYIYGLFRNILFYLKLTDFDAHPYLFRRTHAYNSHAWVEWKYLTLSVWFLVHFSVHNLCTHNYVLFSVDKTGTAVGVCLNFYLFIFKMLDHVQVFLLAVLVIYIRVSLVVEWQEKKM